MVPLICPWTWKKYEQFSNVVYDSKPRLAGSADTTVLRNRFLADWITEIFGTSYKNLNVLGQDTNRVSFFLFFIKDAAVVWHMG